MSRRSPVLLIIQCLLICSCATKKEVEYNETSDGFLESIQGSWVSDESNDTLMPTTLYLEVHGNLFQFLTDYKDSVRFTLDSNMIYVHDSLYPEYRGSKQIYQILELTPDKLTMLSKSELMNNSLKLYRWHSDTISFHRVQKKNNLEPVSIGFMSGPCFGKCEIMRVRIDNDRKFKFYGDGFTKVEGPYSGIVSEELYTQIIDKIQQIPLERIKENYSVDITCLQSTYLVIETKDTVIKTSVYGGVNDPFELQQTLNLLMDAYYGVDLTKDSTIDKSSAFHEFNMANPFSNDSKATSLPPPPPPKN